MSRNDLLKTFLQPQGNDENSVQTEEIIAEILGVLTASNAQLIELQNELTAVAIAGLSQQRPAPLKPGKQLDESAPEYRVRMLDMCKFTRLLESWFRVMKEAREKMEAAADRIELPASAALWGMSDLMAQQMPYQLPSYPLDNRVRVLNIKFIDRRSLRADS